MRDDRLLTLLNYTSVEQILQKRRKWKLSKIIMQMKQGARVVSRQLQKGSAERPEEPRKEVIPKVLHFGID